MKVSNNLNLSIISYLFYGVLKTITICKGCNDIFYNFQYFQYLSFPTFNYKDMKFNIYHGFKDFIRPNLMSEEDKCYCQRCKGLRDMKITTKIYHTPPYLIINIDYGENKKYKPKEVTFGGIIDIKDFVDDANKSFSIQYKLIINYTFYNSIWKNNY
jgi:ubiquitin C-terminal hydrolase